MAKSELVATRGFKYMTRRLLPGDIFEARNDIDALILTRVRKVAEAPQPKPARKAPAEVREVEPVDGYRRYEPVIPTVDEILSAEVSEEAPKPKMAATRRKAKK